MYQDPEGRAPDPSLIADALERGGIHYGVPGATKEDVLRGVASRLPVEDSKERDALYELLIAREEMGSTGVGDGIALPHVRSPIAINEAGEAVISLCFLKDPVDFNAIDKRPVSIVFTLMTPTVRGHLHALSRLAYLLRDRRFNEAIRGQAPASRIFELARELEARRVSERPKLSHP